MTSQEYRPRRCCCCCTYGSLTFCICTRAAAKNDNTRANSRWSANSSDCACHARAIRLDGYDMFYSANRFRGAVFLARPFRRVRIRRTSLSTKYLIISCPTTLLRREKPVKNQRKIAVKKRPTCSTDDGTYNKCALIGTRSTITYFVSSAP